MLTRLGHIELELWAVCCLEQKTDMNSKLLSSHAAIVVMLIVDAFFDLHISINIQTQYKWLLQLHETSGEREINTCRKRREEGRRSERERRERERRVVALFNLQISINIVQVIAAVELAGEIL